MSSLEERKPIPEDVAFEYLVRWMRRDNRFGAYGYHVYLPPVVEAYLREQEGLATPGDIRKRAISPAFYDAAWELCRRGILRPGIFRLDAQATPEGSAGNGYSVTTFGQTWIAKAGALEANLEAHRLTGLLREETLDPLLAEKVASPFRRGDYDTAIFAAFKEVEVRVRDAGGAQNTEIGVPLMRAAFKAETGSLTNRSSDRGEQVAVMETFAGAIGMFKNPSSHRRVEFNAQEAATLIHFANYLLLVVETRRGW